MAWSPRPDSDGVHPLTKDLMPRLKRFPIAAKLLLLAAVLLAFLATTGLIAIRDLGEVDAKGGSMYADRIVPVRDLGEARSLLGDIDSQVLRSFGTPAEDGNLVAAARTDRDRVNKLIGTYETTDLVPEEKSGLVRFHADWSRYLRVVSAIQALAVSGNDADAAARYLTQAAPLYAKVDGDLAQLIRSNDRVAKQLDDEISSTYTSSRRIIIVLLLVALASGGALAYWTARRISRGLRSMVQAAEGLAAGDVDQHVEARTRDEIGDMAAAFEEIIAYNREMAAAAERIAAGDLSGTRLRRFSVMSENARPSALRSLLGSTVRS